MQSDGVRMGYDIAQLSEMINLCHVPLIASGGAGKIDDFVEVFKKSHVSGALAASVFHDKILAINDIKLALQTENIEVRL